MVTLRKKKNRVDIKIRLDKDNDEIRVEVEPKETRPTELIQILLYAIKVINAPLKEEIDEVESKEHLPYIG